MKGPSVPKVSLSKDLQTLIQLLQQAAKITRRSVRLTSRLTVIKFFFVFFCCSNYFIRFILEEAGETSGLSSTGKTAELPAQETLSNDIEKVVVSEAISATSTTEAVETSLDNQQLTSNKVDKALDNSLTKKAPEPRKPIRPKFQRPVAPAGKPDTFEIEFKFDPDDDPFRPKSKLGSSPSKGETPTSTFGQSAFEDNFPSLEANSTINAVTNRNYNA